MRISPAPYGVAICHHPGSRPGCALSTLTTAQRGQFAASERKAWTSPAGRSIVTDWVTERAGAGGSDMRTLLYWPKRNNLSVRLRVRPKVIAHGHPPRVGG